MQGNPRSHDKYSCHYTKLIKIFGNLKLKYHENPTRKRRVLASRRTEMKNEIVEYPN